MKPVSLLIVDDEEVIVKLFERIARREKWSCAAARTGVEALDFLTKNDVECVLLDLNLPSYSGFQVLEFIKSTKPSIEVVIITGMGSVEQAVQALKQGAFDYLSKPFEDMDKVVLTLRNAMEKHRLVRKIHELQLNEEPVDGFQGIIGRSTIMQELYHLINSLKNSSASVLIEGESGTGKEMVAKAIHRTSKRAKNPFWSSIARRFPKASSRASSSATSRAPSPARSPTSAGSSRKRTEGRCSWTRSER